ncbi:hypothetical protein F5X68DRAFT_194503 [Plectosphaerella plurivora]|uniref:Apple domain-containing protein n=1 Tax=Plectosphaerella plurivora TaxID=936078 RepID=A0A9P8V374_9PEZI|nr:hypothetical protein F5X68DRAFT_194503 [Plectosphaerella plurivora]
MKFLGFATLAAAVMVAPCAAQTCTLTGTRGDVPASVEAKPRIPGIKTAEACLAECNKPANSGCKAFAVRTTGEGACLLYNTDLSSSFKSRPSTYTFYFLPAGVVGAVPENVAQHYKADTTKTKGNYEGCRGLCLSEPACKGFGFKEGGNCQLYDVSLEGKVKAKPGWPYIQYQADCVVRGL